MSEKFQKSGAIILKLADYITPEQFEDYFYTLVDNWGFEFCDVENYISMSDDRVRINYKFADFATKPEAIEEIKNFAEACGVAIQGKNYLIE